MCRSVRAKTQTHALLPLISVCQLRVFCVPAKHRQLRYVAMTPGEAQPEEKYFWACSLYLDTSCKKSPTNEPLKIQTARISNDPSVLISTTSTCKK